ncbi:MAG: tryptophanase [Acidobacteriota bacterium]
MKSRNVPVEPFRIKSVERLKKISSKEREEVLKKAGFNVFGIPSDKIFIDLLTDSGTSAMSDEQWGRLMVGDESYAGSRSFSVFEKTVKEIFGFKHVIPTHQGRAAERILFQSMFREGDVVPSNIHFDTTRANIEIRKASALDLAGEEAYNPDSSSPFKGNMDLTKLEQLIKEENGKNIPLVMLTITNNSGGGQPVSMENIRSVSRLCRKYSIPFFFDACRFAENAYFIKLREKAYAKKTITEIVREMFSYADGATMSAKKDALVNIGGFISLNDEQLAMELKNLLIVGEGFPTYGGLAGRDLEAIAQGLKEVTDEDYLDHRTGQVRYLGELLEEAGFPFYRPVGGHAVYLLADRVLSHLPREQYPGWALSVALYREAGIRAVEIGGVMFGKKDEKSGKMIFPRLELVRLAVPRRVYTLSHLHYVAGALSSIYKKREKIKGLRIIKQSPYLRHFTAVLEEIE